MKIKIAVILVFALFGVLPFAATAIPGINVTINPISITSADGITIDYQVVITNEDESFDKNITNLYMEVSQPGWDYSFEPDLIGTTIPAGIGNSITAILHVTIPSNINSQIYNHRIRANASFEVYPDCATLNTDPNFNCFPEEDDFEEFSTEVIGTAATQIPEFPTIALPIVSALGIMLLVQRRKKRN